MKRKSAERKHTEESPERSLEREDRSAEREVRSENREDRSEEWEKRGDPRDMNRTRGDFEERSSV